MRCYANETMTCVEQYTGEYLLYNGIPFQYAIYRNGLQDKLYLVVQWMQESSSNPVLQEVLQCLVGTERYDFAVVSGWEDPVCVLPYQTDETGALAAVYALIPRNYKGVLYYNYVQYREFRLSPGTYATLPRLTMQNVVMAGNYTQTVRWSMTPGDNRQGWAVHMELRYREPGADSYNAIPVFTSTFYNFYQMTTPAVIVGKEACLMVEYRTYAEDWGGYNKDDFATLNRTVTPWQTANLDASVPLAPGGIAVSMLLAGGRVTVQWSGVTDPLNTISAYRLERAVAGAKETPQQFVQLYSGKSTQFRDTLPADAGTVVYRVCAVNRAGTDSPFTDTGIREVAQSNLYVSRGGTWVRAAGVWIGEKRASPMARVK